MDRDFWRNELVGTCTSFALGEQEAKFYKTVCGPGLGVTNIVWNDRTYAMPIPSLELEGNPHPGMVQTPGY